MYLQVWFQNRRSRWRRHEIKNKPPQAATSSIAVFPPFCHRPQSTVTTWSFPASFRPSAATALALKCKANDRVSPVIGQSGTPRGAVMATGFPSTPSIIQSNSLSIKSWITNFSPSVRRSRHSLDEYVAAVTLASGFLRDQ